MRTITPHLLRPGVISYGLVIAVGTTQARRVTRIEQAIDIASTTLANEIGVISWRTDTDGLRCATEEIAKVVSLVNPKHKLLTNHTKYWSEKSYIIHIPVSAKHQP